MAQRRERRALIPVDGNGIDIQTLDLFDASPIEIGGFRLTSASAIPIGRPKIKGWQQALAFAAAANTASPFWLGDLVAHGQDREDWREKLSQAMAVTKHAEQTLHNLGYIARRVGEEVRAIAPTIGHAAEVASLPPAQQLEWMGKASTEGWSVRDMRLEMRAAKRRGILQGQAVLQGLFRVIYADYPWLYDNRPPSGVGQREHYPGMPLEEGLKLPVAAHAHASAVLFFWVTAPFLYYATDPDLGPDAYRLIRAWGFDPKSSMIWDKVDHNPGSYVSVRHEILIIATRGSCTPDRPTPMIDSLVTERPTDHSAKPAIFRRHIERLYDGPYLELFGREPAEGWSVFGNDAALWSNEAAAQEK